MGNSKYIDNCNLKFREYSLHAIRKYSLHTTYYVRKNIQKRMKGEKPPYLWWFDKHF